MGEKERMKSVCVCLAKTRVKGRKKEKSNGLVERN